MSKPRPFFAVPRPARAFACLLLLTAALPACSDDARRGPNSEMRADPPTGPPAAGAGPALAPPAADIDADALPGAGRRYQVRVERAYFFDQPEQSTPSGRYLRRGDTFYGEGERNGFVKSGFVQPNGVDGVAWLKAPELRALTDNPAPARPPGRPRVASSPPPVYRNEAAVTSQDPQNRPGPAPVAPAATAVVRVPRAYFFPSPELAQPRRAYCERGDRVRLGAVRGAAVFVTFTNWEKVTTTGWMRQDNLRVSR